ncbi:MAG: YbdD/YjiX family protein [Gemmatimonadales bacterium]|nr:YbdD/YjiX family protein [Gemmatimonadales bacterium]
MPARPISLRARLAALAGTVRRICGMPDYAQHVAHLRRSHPDRPLPTEREYFDGWIRARYGDGPTRCC